MSGHSKKIIILPLIVTLAGFIAMKVFTEEEIRNYPSSGTDIVAFGDSLVYGTGASSGDANLVSGLSRRIGKPIVNLGVPGNTTDDALKRLYELDMYNPKVVIVLLGGNDYLRKVPKTQTFRNLEKIIQNIQARGSVVLLLGVRGGILSDNFKSDFEAISEKYGTAYVPDVLSGLITRQEYMSDAVHPNDEGYRLIADKVYPVLNDLD